MSNNDHINFLPLTFHRLLSKMFSEASIASSWQLHKCLLSNRELGKNTLVCKDCNHSINQWRAYHLFSPWWCASLLLVSEAQTLGWNVSLCVQVESALCASAFLCITRPAKKNSGRDMRGIHSGELHPILFFFSLFISPGDVSSQLKGYISQHHFNVLTPQLWGVEIGKKKHCQRTVLWCQWTPEVQHERGDFVYVECFYWQHRHAVTHHWLHPWRWIMFKWANIVCLLYTLTVFTLDHIVMFCFAAK